MPLIVVCLAFVVGGVWWIVSDRNATERAYDEYSTANTSDDGLSLAAQYLARRGRVVRMLTRALDAHPIPSQAVLFRVAEELPVFYDVDDESEAYGPIARRRDIPLLSDAEEAFVRGGGRLVIAATASSGTLDRRFSQDKTVRKVFPIWSGIDTFTVDDPRGWAAKSLPQGAVVLYETGDEAVIARVRAGSGELFLVATPEIFKNGELAKGNYLALLTALAGNRKLVYFDEVMHGIASDDGALAIMKDWNLGPLLLLLAAVAVAVFWRNGKRIGPADDEERDTRSEAVDLVDSLGALYRRATGDAEAISLYRDALTRTVALQTGLRGEALQKRVETLCARNTGSDFQTQLATINEAFRRLSGGKH